MDAFLDKLWFKIIELTKLVVQGMDTAFSPLNLLGPAAAIAILAGLTLLFVKLVSPRFSTKRYKSLQKDFGHWFELRQEAMKHPDREKGKRLARNVDQAGLNRTYYDYFFEGFLLSLISKYLPFLCMLAYVNESYRSQRLQELFGREYIFTFGDPASPTLVGAVFWFVVSYIVMLLAWSVISRLMAGRRKKRAAQE